MSTDYLTDLPIRMSELDALKKNGVRIKKDESGCILTLSDAHLHACSESKYTPAMFSRYGDNDTSELFQLIEKTYGVEFVSEHEDGYEWLIARAEKRSREAKCCPSCSSEDIADILYGMPCMSVGMERVL